MELIEVGDEIQNFQDMPVEVTDVQKAKHGLLCTGRFVASHRLFMCFLPWELQLSDDISGWYGWPFIRHITLASGFKVGSLSLKRSDSRLHISQEYDLEWERTIATIRDEQMAAMGESDDKTRS